MGADLSTSWLGLRLKNPLVLAASPLTAEIHRIEQFVDAGVSAAVLTSLFAEQIDESGVCVATGALMPGRGFDGLGSFAAGPDAYLRQLKAAKRCLAVPIIASLNVSTAVGWMGFAKLIQETGADALELNVYFVPTDPAVSGSEVEARYLEIASQVRKQITIPLSMKLGPYFSSLPHFGKQLMEAGVDGLVLFNRYMQPAINLDTFEVCPHLTLSTSEEVRLSTRWIAILREQLPLSLAVTGGVHTVEDLVQSILAGADIAMLASALIKHGPLLVPKLLEGLEAWLLAKGFGSVSEARGLVSFRGGANSSNYVRASYAEALAKFSWASSRSE